MRCLSPGSLAPSSRLWTLCPYLFSLLPPLCSLSAVHMGPALGLASAMPASWEQKQTGSMDSDDFRALLISTGYSLVCSLCLPCLCSSPSPSLPPELPYLPGATPPPSSATWPCRRLLCCTRGAGVLPVTPNLPLPTSIQGTVLQLSPSFLFLCFLSLPARAGTMDPNPCFPKLGGRRPRGKLPGPGAIWPDWPTG